MRDHVVSVPGGKSEGFLCAVCGKLISRRDHMRRHMQNVHVGVRARYRCPVCFKVFAETKFAAHIEKQHPKHASDFGNLEQFRIDRE